jgi:hypothetical protein
MNPTAAEERRTEINSLTFRVRDFLTAMATFVGWLAAIWLAFGLL